MMRSLSSTLKKRRRIAGTLLPVLGGGAALATFTVGRAILGGLCLVAIFWVVRRVIKRAQQLPDGAVESTGTLRYPDATTSARVCTRKRVRPPHANGPGTRSPQRHLDRHS